MLPFQFTHSPYVAYEALAKLGNIAVETLFPKWLISCGTKIWVRETKMSFTLSQKYFLLTTQNSLPQPMFPVWLNWETLTSATMFPSLGPDIGHIDNIYFNWEYLRAVFRYQFLVLV